jgi:CHC2 zinc finger
MSARAKLDFQEIKARVSLEQVMKFLQLQLKKSAGQFRGSCPVHGRGDRPSSSPEQGFYCFAEKEGGDQIALYAHVRECNNYDAAAALSEHFKASSPAPPASNKGLKPLDYLYTSHEVLELLGLSPAVCEALGAGYAERNGARARRHSASPGGRHPDWVLRDRHKSRPGAAPQVSAQPR